MSRNESRLIVSLCLVFLLACAPSASAETQPASAQRALMWIASLKPLSAGGWKYLTDGGSTSDPLVVYFSTHDIQSHRSIITAWFRWEMMKPETYLSFQYLSDVVRTEINCATDSTRDFAITYYSGNNLAGKNESQVENPNDEQWSPVVPGTIGEFIFDSVCAKKRMQRH